MSDPCGEVLVKALFDDTKKLNALSGGIAMIVCGYSDNDVHAKLDEADKLIDIVKLHITTLKGYL